MNITNLPVTSDLLQAKLRALMARIEASNDLMTKAGSYYKLLQDFFLKLSKPVFEPEELREDDPPSSEIYNNLISAIYQDLEILEDEFKRAADLQQASFNYALSSADGLAVRLAGLISKLTDLDIVAGFVRGDVLVAGDDLVDDQFIDRQIATAAAPAELMGGSIGLARTRATSIEINSLELEVIQTPRGASPAYEGLWFGMIGEQQPTGGKLHLEPVPVVEELPADFVVRDGAEIDWEAIPVYKEGEPGLEDKLTERVKSFDQNPDTFWQIETVVKQETVPQGTFTIALTCELDEPQAINLVQLNPMQFNPNCPITVSGLYYAGPDVAGWQLVPNWASLATDNILTQAANKYLTSAQQQALLVTNKSGFRGQGVWAFPTITAEKLRIVLSIDRSYVANYERLYVTMRQDVGVETVKKKRTLFGTKKKTGWEYFTFYTTVKLSYLQTLLVKLGLVDKNAFLMPTEEDVEKASQETGKSSELSKLLAGGAFIPGAGSYIYELSKVIDKAFGTKLSKAIGGAIQAVLNAVGLGSEKKTVYVHDYGWQVVKEWLQPQFDANRFAIGIREIQFNKFLFAEKSEFISVPWLSPKPISKVYLISDEVVPIQFPIGQYIKYWIQPVIEGYEGWHQINPMGKATQFTSTGEVVPRIINFNVRSPEAQQFENRFIFTDEPVTKVRVKVEFSRPALDSLEFEGYTPMLKSYKLILWPEGGL